MRIFHDGGFAPVSHLWTKRAQPRVHLTDDLLLYPGEPESDDDIYAAYQARNSHRRQLQEPPVGPAPLGVLRSSSSTAQ